jgi:hypothetical protein
MATTESLAVLARFEVREALTERGAKLKKTVAVEIDELVCINGVIADSATDDLDVGESLFVDQSSAVGSVRTSIEKIFAYAEEIIDCFDGELASRDASIERLFGDL